MSFIIICLTDYCYGVKFKALEIGTVYGKEKIIRNVIRKSQ